MIVAIIFYPLGYGFWVSLTDYYLPNPPPVFTGLKNYVSLITDRDFVHSIAVTAIITVSAVAVQLILGFFLANLLNKIKALRKILTTALFLPHMIVPVVAGLILKWMFIPDWGMVNYFLGLVGIRGPDWLNTNAFALIAVILADIWLFTPLVVVIFLAGLQSLSPEPIEAAIVDGVHGFKMLWYIILPMLKQIILFIMIIRTMDTFRIFDSVFVLTGGGPGTATETLTIFNYRISFNLYEIGRGAAAGTWTLLFLLGAICVYLYILYEREQ